MKKKLRVIADKIIVLEQKCQKGENISANMEQIEKLTTTLSVEEMLEIDDYIMSKKIN
jgi:hypothetical protein